MKSKISLSMLCLFFLGYTMSVLGYPSSSWSPKTVCQFAYRVRHGVLPQTARCVTCLSQGTQDHILEQIFSVIGATNRYCVEFGFGYGAIARNLTMGHFHAERGIISGLNTHRLIQQGWIPTFFDAEYENHEIRLFKAVLSRESIGKHFENANIPKQVDYVSIDVDSIEVWLLMGLLESGYRPRVISLEFNINFKVDMPITCSDQWAPWRTGSRIYGSSAGAINIVAEKFGYKMVEMMTNLDLFLVRQDILEETCSNVDQLPTYHELAEGILGLQSHSKCDMNEARERLVDFPLAAQGKHAQASKKAMEYVEELNQHFQGLYQEPFCPV